MRLAAPGSLWLETGNYLWEVGIKDHQSKHMTYEERLKDLKKESLFENIWF